MYIKCMNKTISGISYESNIIDSLNGFANLSSTSRKDVRDYPLDFLYSTLKEWFDLLE